MEWSTLTLLGGLSFGTVVWLLRQQTSSLNQRFSPSSLSRAAQDPYHRLESVEEITAAAALGLKLDVNQATVDDWLRLPGLSIHQARLLTELTQSGVQFHCLEDIAAALGIPTQRLKPLAPILSFCYYDPDGIADVKTINLNTASIEVLTTVPGIDLYLARAIAHHRTQSGAYKNLVDLQQRLNLPASLVADLMHYLRF